MCRVKGHGAVTLPWANSAEGYLGFAAHSAKGYSKQHHMLNSPADKTRLSLAKDTPQFATQLLYVATHVKVYIGLLYGGIL
jgi:hypothetical protein